MSGAEPFFDTNVLLYLLSSDQAKADRAEALLAKGGVVSVQVLNEFASVATRKLGMTIPEVREALEVVRAVCRVVPLTEDTHDKGLVISERYRPVSLTRGGKWAHLDSNQGPRDYESPALTAEL